VALAGSATVAIAALQLSRVFGDARDTVDAAVAAILAGVVAAWVARRRWVVRAVAYAATALVASLVAAIREGDSIGSLPSSLLTGIGDAMGAAWPSPPFTSTIVAFVAIGAVAGGVAADLAVHRRAALGLVPSLGVWGLVALLSARAGDPPVVAVVAWILAMVVLLRVTADDRTAGGGWLYLVLAVVLAVVVPLVGATALSRDRFDPRDTREPQPITERTAAPLGRLLEWRSITPAVEMFRADHAAPARWRLVALPRYDGRAWLPADDYRVFGGTVDTPFDGAPTVDVEVTMGELESRWVPTVGHVVEVAETERTDGGGDGADGADGGLQVDGQRTSILTGTAPAVGDAFELAVQFVEVQPSELSGIAAADPDSPAIEIPASITDLATLITSGATSDVDRAASIARYLAAEYALDPETPPGHSLAELELFLTRSRRGNDEQFVAAYGLLAAAAGLPVRVVVGFEAAADPSGGSVAMSSGATAWPEVEFDGFGWVAFDPLPTSTDVGGTGVGEGDVAPVQAPIATTPSTAPPAPPSADAPEADNEVLELTPTVGTSPLAVVALAGSAVVLLALLAYVPVVLWLKRRIRRRRRLNDDRAVVVAGAFDTGIDRVVDLGTTVNPAMTNRELVIAASDRVRGAAHLLEPVSESATAAVFAKEPPPPSTGENAWERLSLFERATTHEVGRLRQIRAALSLRSLRRARRARRARPARTGRPTGRFGRPR
jgi:transglutaminase-like putative cysteine protease